ncbi:alanine racemase [Anaerocolumna cellulosilytica]|uniref:Alanine racemase n=1 Tax=Anaerocolumna cellulosilytica TaxID=433286 RepID=A0A6S6QY35_9FIRM|nr:alanine racemase [Anaerocolumna cellulosilytica]MBB5197907.1 alanine racemase [Anaerocolumna cellulosilytica]BCJ95544.1 alanine racemase [Anaerocolumna cellulosilytica]
MTAENHESEENEVEGRYFRVTANINLDAIYHNIEKTKNMLTAGAKLMVIIKADGYGHGAVPIARTLYPLADAYGIAIIEEAIELRKNGIDKPILVLGHTSKEQYKQLVEYDITQTIFQYCAAKELAIEARREKKCAKIHIKIDTGMSRIGFYDSIDSIEEVKKIARLEGIEIEGIFSHFACADASDKTSAKRQLERFLSFIKQLEEEGIYIPVKHMANSAGIIDLPEAYLDMVRSGIATYGMYPSEEVIQKRIPLEPAMEIKTHVSYVKEVEAGIGVSYGSTYVTEKKTKIATIPVGYGDGYPRQLSSKGRVLIHGKAAPIIGRVCMDQFMVDASNIEEVKQGDVVTLVGEDNGERITVEELAALAYSFNYEFVCNVGKRVPRIYYRNGKAVEIRE